MRVVERARREDLNKPLTYQVAFIYPPGSAKDDREGDGGSDGGGGDEASTSGRDGGSSSSVIYDRRFNMAALMVEYYGPDVDFSRRIRWDPSDPNVLELDAPGGLGVRTRVTRRFAEAAPQERRLETSEFVEQVFSQVSVGGCWCVCICSGWLSWAVGLAKWCCRRGKLGSGPRGQLRVRTAHFTLQLLAACS